MIVETVRNRLEEVDEVLGTLATDLGVPLDPALCGTATLAQTSLRTRLLLRLGAVGEFVELAYLRHRSRPLGDALTMARSATRQALALADAALEGRRTWVVPMSPEAAYALVGIDQQLITSFDECLIALLALRYHPRVATSPVLPTLLTRGQRVFVHQDALETTLLGWNNVDLPDITAPVTVTIPGRVNGRRPQGR